MAETDELQLLENEIRRLQRKASQLEKDIDQRIDYFQDNYRSLAIKSFLPSFLAKAGFTGTILELLLENKQFRSSLNKITDRLFDKIGDGISYFSSKFAKKESTKKESEA
jgi:hypothetical protein